MGRSSHRETPALWAPSQKRRRATLSRMGLSKTPDASGRVQDRARWFAHTWPTSWRSPGGEFEYRKFTRHLPPPAHPLTWPGCVYLSSTRLSHMGSMGSGGEPRHNARRDTLVCASTWPMPSVPMTQALHQCLASGLLGRPSGRPDADWRDVYETDMLGQRYARDQWRGVIYGGRVGNWMAQ